MTRLLDPVGSTSWHHRHWESFRRLNELLTTLPKRVFDIMVVGPGAVTRLLAPWLNDSSRPTRGRWRRLMGDAARYGDQVLRRLPAMPLRSLEPLELQTALSVPHRLIVVDRSERVLAAVGRDLPTACCIRADLEQCPQLDPADAVVAFNVVCRLTRPAAGLAAVAEAVRPAGWLLIDDRSAVHLTGRGDFLPVGNKIHQRCRAPL